MPQLIESVAVKASTAPKLTNYHDREEVTAEIAMLDRRGYTHFEISIKIEEKFKIRLSRQTIDYKVKLIRQNYRKVQNESQAELIAEKLEQYREIRREAWEAYIQSKLDADKKVSEYIAGMPGELPDRVNGALKKMMKQSTKVSDLIKIKEIITREGRLPGTQYLHIVMKTLEAERELLGLDEAKKINVAQTTINWDVLLNPSQESVLVDPIEERIKQAALPPTDTTEAEFSVVTNSLQETSGVPPESENSDEQGIRAS